MNLNDKLQKWIREHPKADYMQRCLRRRNDKHFVDFVLRFQREPNIIGLKSFGEENKDKNIYVIECGNAIDGFFAIYREMLDFLYFADRYHFAPVVTFSQDMRYAEQKPVNGSWNPFEYFFEQPCGISVEEAMKSYNVIECDRSHSRITAPLRKKDGKAYSLTDEYCNALATITKKYVRLNDGIKKQIENQIAVTLGGRKTLGIHIRGTDFKAGYYNHPAMADRSEYLKETEKAMLGGGFEQIFLATDDSDMKEYFTGYFKGKLVLYEDAQRSSEQTSVMFSHSNRENHHYLLGYEVLRDMLTLAACDGLIAGVSQVSICTQITKKSYGEDYHYLKILDKGLNINGRLYKGI